MNNNQIKQLFLFLVTHYTPNSTHQNNNWPTLKLRQTFILYITWHDSIPKVAWTIMSIYNQNILLRKIKFEKALMSYFNYLLLRKSIEFCSNEPCKRFRFKCKEHFCTLIYNLDETRIFYAYT